MPGVFPRLLILNPRKDERSDWRSLSSCARHSGRASKHRSQTRAPLSRQDAGNGPAFDLRFVAVPTDSPIQWEALPNISTILNGAVLGVGRQEPEVAGVQLCGSPSEELQIMYTSLSGKQYVSIVRFDSQQRLIQSVPKSFFILPARIRVKTISVHLV